MSRIRGRSARRLTGALLSVVALGTSGLLVRSGDAQAPDPAVHPLPVLGTLDQAGVLMGSVTDGGRPGETWALRQLPADVGPPAVDGKRLAFGPVANALRPDPQLAFLRHTDATGWQVAQTPVDVDGKPWRGVTPNAATARVLARGGGYLVGRDPSATGDQQAKLLVRDAGQDGPGPFAEVPAPGPDVLEPAAPGPDGAAETLAADRGLGRVAIGGYESQAGTRVFVAPQGRATTDGILRWDGTRWTREPIVLPTPAPDGFSVTALDAADGADAYFVATVSRPAADPDQAGVVLYHRTLDSDGAPVWRQQALGAPVFAAAATPSRGVQDVATLAGGVQQTLTATATGVWIDGRLRGPGRDAPQDFTLYLDADAGKVTASWCDVRSGAGAALCDHPLGFSFSRRTGYRSIAFAGAGPGGRIITDPLDRSDDEATNLGTYVRLQGDVFIRRPAGNGNLRFSAAFASPDDGWLEGPVRVGTQARPGRLSSVPVSVRSPFTGVANEPGRPAGALDARALAVGAAGAVARFVPGQGWVREFLLTSAGAVTSPTLRGVAWPEQGRAYAVGDQGAMWLWRADTGLWERDPSTPIGFEGNLMGVAFRPGDPSVGFAVGRSGVLLRYDKTWTQEALPDGFQQRDLTSIAYAGSQAVVAARGDLLVNDGGPWRVDEQARQLLRSSGNGDVQLLAVAGLPDGGAVAAGRDVVLERDAGDAPWRLADQPLPGATVVAAAAFRDADRVRAVVSVQPRLAYPPAEEVPAEDPNVPTPLQLPLPLPGDGYVLRETAGGWRDEQDAAFVGASADRPRKADPVLAFDLDGSGQGWAVGGWSGEQDSAGRGSSGRNATGRANRARVQTAGILRYSVGEAVPAAAGAGEAAVALPSGVVAFAVAGHAQCETDCAELADQDILPDRTLSAVLGRVGELAGQPSGPRFLLYTGGRSRPQGDRPQPAAEAARLAQLLGRDQGPPAYAAVSEGDSDGGGPAAFRSAFGAFPAPFGSGAAPPGVTPLGPPAADGAQTHYAFDSVGDGGTVRVIVIDNSQGSLAASDPYQRPAEPQAPWLSAQLADAKARGVASVVMGSRDLNPRFSPALNVATDADETAALLVAGGASAYFYERPEENRSTQIPAGAPATIPEFGTGTLGYRSPLSDTSGSDQPDALFGDAGFLLAQVEAGRRDATSNRAPVSVRLIPVVEDLALQAVDGTLLRRSRPALFQGLGRRPVAGDRWGEVSGADGNPNPPGGDPYTAFPPAQCVGAGCPSRVSPEFTFTSSDPAIADFVRQDPASTNLRKPLIGADDKVITDHASGLLCPFFPGKTTITVRAGGLAFSQEVTVQAGSVQRPCGTRVQPADRFTTPVAAVVPPPGAPASAPAAAPSAPPPVPPPPPPPAPAPAPTPVVKAVPKPVPAPAALPPAAPPPLDPLIPPVKAAGASTPSTPPPATAGFARPIPPGGAVIRVLEEKREEEAAPEQSSAFAVYDSRDGAPVGPLLFGAVVLAAALGATAATAVRRRPRDRSRGAALALVRLDDPLRRADARRTDPARRHAPSRSPRPPRRRP